MMTIRRAATLGTNPSSDVNMRCHFAFQGYQDAAHIHEGRLRVANTAVLRPGECFRLEREHDVDIVTWVQQGELITHTEDFLPETVPAGALHVLRTGTGCTDMAWHAGADGASFVQLWFLADEEGMTPCQEIREDDRTSSEGGFQILASGFPEDDPEENDLPDDAAPVTLSSRARFLLATIPTGEGAAYDTVEGRDLYLILVSGNVKIGNEELTPGDGASFEGEQQIVVIAEETAVVLLADVAA